MTVRYADAGEIRIAYETFGDPADPALLLVTGLGVQLLGWDEAFCRLLADRGLHVVRFDNRDVGESTHLHDAPRPDVVAALSGDRSSAAYTLWDMGDDTARLVDALGLARVHVVGTSMGGMIAQCLAIRYPGKVASLTSVMSTTGDPAALESSPEAIAVLLRPPAADRDGYIEASVAGAKVIGSPGFPFDEAAARARAAASYDRAFDPMGVGRQLLAIYASGSRTAELRKLDVPTLVLHGSDDPLIGLAGGRATAAAVPGARLEVIDGMGHDLPPGAWPRIVDAIAGHVDHAEAALRP